VTKVVPGIFADNVLGSGEVKALVDGLVDDDESFRSCSKA